MNLSPEEQRELYYNSIKTSEEIKKVLELLHVRNNRGCDWCDNKFATLYNFIGLLVIGVLTSLLGLFGRKFF